MNLSRELRCIALLTIPIFALPCAAGKKAPSLPDWAIEAFGRPFEAGDADVVILHEEKIVRPGPGGGTRVTTRLAGKVLKRDGIEWLTANSVYYVPDDTISRLRAWTRTADERVLSADPDEDVVDQPYSQGALVINDARIRVIDAPGVVVGSFVAFETERIVNFDWGTESFTFGYRTVPTVYSRFELAVPQGWEWDSLVERGEPLEINEQDSGIVILAHDLGPIEGEKRRPASSHVRPVAWFRWWDKVSGRGYGDWNAVGRQFWEAAGRALTEPGEAREVSARLAPTEQTGLLDALAAAFKFAARDIRYVSIDVGLGIGAGHQPDTPANVCNKRYGDCKDKSILLRALTEPWGLSTYAVLVRTEDLGAVQEEVPSPGQFNHCIAAVVLPEGVGEGLWSTTEVPEIGRVVFLDATDRNGSPWALRRDIQGTRALLVHEEGGTFIDLPIQPPDSGRREIVLDLELDAGGGIVAGRLERRWFGTEATRIRAIRSGQTAEEISNGALQRLHRVCPGAGIEVHRVAGLDDTALDVVEIVEFSGGRGAKKVGNLLIVEPGLAAAGVVYGSLPRSEGRTAPVDVGLPRQETFRITIRSPSGWVPEEVPESYVIEAPHIRATGEWSVDDDQLGYHRNATLLSGEVPAGDYSEFRRAVIQVREADEQAVVLVETP